MKEVINYSIHTNSKKMLKFGNLTLISDVKRVDFKFPGA
jgi:hypothetical protein